MQKFKIFFLNEKIIFSIILINSFTIFFEGFDNFPSHLKQIIIITDSIITILFIVEAIVKIQHFKWKGYISQNWNKLDFILVIFSLPSFLIIFERHITLDLSFLLIFRITRIFKFLRFFKFIPGISHLLKGIVRALKTSVFVFLVFLVYNFIISVLSCYLFKEFSSEFFGDPFKSFYSTFRIFTVEGWYEIPEAMIKTSSGFKEAAIKIYFILVLITGGIFGLSLVNSVFVDSMVSDNTDDLEKKVEELNKKIEYLIKLQENNK